MHALVWTMEKVIDMGLMASGLEINWAVFMHTQTPKAFVKKRYSYQIFH